MTTDDFLDYYLNEPSLDIFDLTCDFFSRELPEDFLEESDVGEVLLETKGHQEEAKNFENVLKFSRIIKENHPQLYEDFFEYFDDFLVDYYCFLHDTPKIEAAFSNFLKKPLQDYDAYLKVFKQLLFYQQTPMLERAITENFRTIYESEEFTGDPEYDLAECKLLLTLEQYHNGSETYDKEKFIKILTDYNYEPEDDFIKSIEEGLFQPTLEVENLMTYFAGNKAYFLTVIEMHFLKFMVQNGLRFYVSGRIWRKMSPYWQALDKNGKKEPDGFFRIEPLQFEKYLAHLADNFLFTDYPEVVSVLWGSVYIYEFLRKEGIISQSVFDDFLEISKKMKGIVIASNLPYLWRCNFVHNWEKPHCISQNEFMQEVNIFKKSFSLNVHGEFYEQKSEIAEELDAIGDFADYILEAAKADEIRKMKKPEFTGNPIIKEKTPGRNDPCPCGSGKKYKKCCGKG